MKQKLSVAPTLKNYDKKNLPKDILAGIIIMAVSIPISMGYAQISGLPAVYGLYILGGLAGAVLFVLAYNIFPYFQNVASFSYLMGASASVMAIVFAVSFYRKDLEINLFLIGRIKLIYLAIFTLVIDLLAMTSDNAGGHIAHIGGALFGMWFASRIRNGKDLTAPMNRLIDWFVNLGKRKPKMRVTYKRNETDYEYNARKHQESVDLDTILDKLKRSGYESLSAEEKKRLFDASKK